MQRKDKPLWYLTVLASLLFCTITEATAQTSSEIAEKALDSLGCVYISQLSTPKGQ